LLLDLPGHGLNSNNVIKKVDPKKLHNSIKETLDCLNIKKAHFIGLSMGTIVIVNFAVCYPEYVDSIILGGSSLQVSGIYRIAVMLVNKLKYILPYKILYKFFAWFLLPKKNHKKSRQIFLREVIKLHKKTMYAWIDYLQMVLNFDYIIEQLDNIKKKILIISGEEDHCFLKDAKALINKVKDIQINIIKKCGHVCSIEKWKDFNNIALNFLELNLTRR
jgi:pimeloyl-ACP methyl ester carboxylesterase